GDPAPPEKRSGGERGGGRVAPDRPAQDAAGPARRDRRRPRPRIDGRHRGGGRPGDSQAGAAEAPQGDREGVRARPSDPPLRRVDDPPVASPDRPRGGRRQGGRYPGRAVHGRPLASATSGASYATFTW